MVSDSTINASIPNVSKDFGKKKRANRSAKLKQCKLDARREQWLSQVKNKNCKEEVNVPVVGGGKFNGPAIVTWKKAAQCCKVLEVDNPGVEEISHHFSDSESSPSNSPTNALVGASDANQGHNSNSNLSPGRETAEGLNFEGQLPICENVDAQLEKSKSVGVGILGRGSENCKAWRPDDAFRPQSLPNLAKQHSFPTGAERLQGFGNPWVRNNMTPRVPTSCPICCEDLDLTDSSFLPCPCGFHLCLFCHKRILEEDSRCPGCRKEYASEPVEKEASVSGGSLTIRLARSCSMSSSRV
uniref:RING-type domain-containing protein n=1 Tax=Chenopodium quinoa TaxID=63459 RepID=A0A803L8W0_CHEQI